MTGLAKGGQSHRELKFRRLNTRKGNGTRGDGWLPRTNEVAIQGRRCRQRLFGVVVDSIGLMLAVARGQARSRSRGSERRKPEAWKLKIQWVLVDNKSAAEISKRHLVVGAEGT
jgi:hypothetical protein